MVQTFSRLKHNLRFKNKILLKAIYAVLKSDTKKDKSSFFSFIDIPQSKISTFG